MQIKHYKMSLNNINNKVLEKLLTNKMYMPTGILKDVYLNPEEFFEEDGYISVLSHKKKPISTLYIGKNIYHNWNHTYPGLEKTYGMLAFYTDPDYRKKGYARILFESFDKTFHVRILSAARRCEGILKSVSNKDKFFIDDGYQGE